MKFAFVALTGIDKTSHAAGQGDPLVLDAMRIVDDTVAQIRSDAERDGRWEKMHLWVGSDHGHSSVSDTRIWRLLKEWRYRTLAHPWAFNTLPSCRDGKRNAMAHLYVDIEQRSRPWWPALGEKWGNLAKRLLERESVDLMILPTSQSSCEIHTRDRGAAKLTWTESIYSYLPQTGDPLDIGEKPTGAR